MTNYKFHKYAICEYCGSKYKRKHVRDAFNKTKKYIENNYKIGESIFLKTMSGDLLEKYGIVRIKLANIIAKLKRLWIISDGKGHKQQRRYRRLK